jgi:hypothetical protein
VYVYVRVSVLERFLYTILDSVWNCYHIQFIKHSVRSVCSGLCVVGLYVMWCLFACLFAW